MMKIIFSNHHVCWFKKIIYYTFIIALRAVVAKNQAGQKVTFSDHQVS